MNSQQEVISFAGNQSVGIPLLEDSGLDCKPRSVSMQTSIWYTKYGVIDKKRKTLIELPIQSKGFIHAFWENHML